MLIEFPETKSYTHFPAKKLQTAQQKIDAARITVTTRVGISKHRAKPIQKSEKRIDAVRESRRTEPVKVIKRISGNADVSNWRTKNVKYRGESVANDRTLL